MNTLVMKFGGASVAHVAQFSYIADLILTRLSDYQRIAVVVSAMQGTTDHLIQLAREVHPNPPEREYDMLISVGERISMSLLAMALCLKNQDALSFTGSQSGIITCCNYSQAKILDVKPHRIKECLSAGKIAIVAGFQGVSTQKEVTTLGRGGSDTTAVALAIALAAEKVEFFKDVPGICCKDPKEDPLVPYFTHLTYEQTLSIVENGAKILHPRAVRLAEINGLPLHVRSFLANKRECLGTWISDESKKRSCVPIYESDS